MNLNTLHFCCYTLVGFGEKFSIQNKSTSQGLPYDFSSIMHFRHDAYSRAQFESTVVPHNRTIRKTILGSSDTATDLDFLHLNLLYCGGTDVITSYSQTIVHSFVTSWNCQISHTVIREIFVVKKFSYSSNSTKIKHTKNFQCRYYIVDQRE